MTYQHVLHRRLRSLRRSRSSILPPPIEGLSISRQSWLREGGFLIAEITFTNKNEFPVQGVIIACDFFEPPHLYIGRRGSLIVRILPPGKTAIGGMEFTMLKHNVFDPAMFRGACFVASDASAIR